MPKNETKHRVVITGMGVLSSNAHGLDDFEAALRAGRSGIRKVERLTELKFSCQVGGIPQCVDELKRQYFTEDRLIAMNSGMIFAGIAAVDCWKDAGLPISQLERDSDVDWDTGAIIGTGVGGVDTLGDLVIPKVNAGQVRRLGSATVEQTMSSAVSALVGGLFGLGGPVTSNSSACSTGTEAISNAYDLIRQGRIRRMIAGSAEGSSQYIWGGFDAMRVLAKGHNETPEKASRPMSASSSGFVPSSGGGVLMLESLESAQARGAKIYAEIIGSHINCGGQRGGGSITAPNPSGVRRCIKEALNSAQVKPGEIDLINGHLTATMADSMEILNWSAALELAPKDMPLINSTKSMIGHGLGAAGSIECIGTVLQLQRGFVHGSINCEDLNPALEPFADRIVHKTVEKPLRTVAKASFGFGDVNTCVVFKQFET